MTKAEALQVLENLPDDEFASWFSGLPQRVQLTIKGGLANWKEVLPEWWLFQRCSKG